MDQATKSGPRLEKIGFSGPGDLPRKSVRGLFFCQPLAIQFQWQLNLLFLKENHYFLCLWISFLKQTRLLRPLLFRVIKRCAKFQTNQVTDLQPEVGAERWLSFEVSGLVEWEEFLGLAESAQP